jgi:hypothetical protein
LPASPRAAIPQAAIVIAIKASQLKHPNSRTGTTAASRAERHDRATQPRERDFDAPLSCQLFNLTAPCRRHFM